MRGAERCLWVHVREHVQWNTPPQQGHGLAVPNVRTGCGIDGGTIYALGILTLTKGDRFDHGLLKCPGELRPPCFTRWDRTSGVTYCLKHSRVAPPSGRFLSPLEGPLDVAIGDLRPPS